MEHLEIAHPFIKGFDRISLCVNETEKNDAAHGSYPARPPKPQDDIDVMSESTEDYNVDKDLHGEQGETLYTTTFYIGLAIKPKDPNMPAARKLDISWPISDFMKMVKGSETFEEEHMGIVVQYIKSSSLPQDVFEEGDVRPVKKRSKSVRVSLMI